MSLKIHCPQCHSNLRVADRLRGKRFRCPKCAAVVTVPADAQPEEGPKREAAAAPLAEAQVAARGKRRSAPSRPQETGGAAGWSPGRWVLLWSVVGTIGTTALVGLVIWLSPQPAEPLRDDVAEKMSSPEAAEGSPDSPKGAAAAEEATPSAQEEAVVDEPVVSAETLAIAAKLREIGRAMDRYRDEYIKFPVGIASADVPDWFDQHGRPYLSWRVHLLPFLGEQLLFDRFRLNEPWDSEHNKPLLEEMPEVYRISPEQTTQTQMHMLWGAAPTDTASGMRPLDIKDGRSNTILVVVAGPDRQDYWTKADCPVLDPAAPLLVLGASRPDPILCLMGDCLPLALPADISAEMFAGFVTANGREIVDGGLYRHRWLLGVEDEPAAEPEPRTIDTLEIAGKLRRIGQAINHYRDKYREFPVAGRGNNPEWFDEQGRPRLSWRVHLLPFVDQQPLYDQFHLDEPWDSPHNKALLGHMPEVYRVARRDATETPMHMIWAAATSAEAVARGLQTQKMGDGRSHTILVVVASAERQEFWTRPDSPMFDRSAPLAVLGAKPPDPILCLMGDSQPMALPADVAPETLPGL